MKRSDRSVDTAVGLRCAGSARLWPAINSDVTPHHYRLAPLPAFKFKGQLMGRMSFVAMLFVMALACLAIALSTSSWGWAIGGVVFLTVGVYARRQFSTERQSGPETASNRFIVFSLLAVVGGIAAIAVLSKA